MDLKNTTWLLSNRMIMPWFFIMFLLRFALGSHLIYDSATYEICISILIHKQQTVIHFVLVIELGDRSNVFLLSMLWSQSRYVYFPVVIFVGFYCLNVLCRDVNKMTDTNRSQAEMWTFWKTEYQLSIWNHLELTDQSMKMGFFQSV